MQNLSEEKSRLLAEKNGWSAAYAEGYVEGETIRRGGKHLSTYALVGIDEYALGFRAGYFDRKAVAFGHNGNAGPADRTVQVMRSNGAAPTAVPEYLHNVRR